MTFRKSPRDDLVESFLNGQYVLTPGVWPLIDQDYNPTPLVVFGDKHGMPENLVNTFKLFKKSYGNEYKCIYGSRRGWHFVDQYAELALYFDGIFDLDYNPMGPKTLRCNFAMMERSMPIGEFFWEPTTKNREYDFGILSWGKVDSEKEKLAKRWDLAINTIDSLCKRGLRGVIVLDQPDLTSSIPHQLVPHIHKKLLKFYTGNFNKENFHRIMSETRYSIFPNQLDAFPKFMIESLLADRPIIVNKDLLHGLSVLEALPSVSVVDFSNTESVADIVQKEYQGPSPRGDWLHKYCLDKLSSLWAREFNRLFQTEYERLYFLHHIDRVKRYFEKVHSRRSVRQADMSLSLFPDSNHA